MKTFEEKWTAWLDGQLTGKELVKFEASLSDKAPAEAEKRDLQKLGALLKEHLARVRVDECGIFQPPDSRSDSARNRRKRAIGPRTTLVERAAPGLGWCDCIAIFLVALFW